MFTTPEGKFSWGKTLNAALVAGTGIQLGRSLLGGDDNSSDMVGGEITAAMAAREQELTSSPYAADVIVRTLMDGQRRREIDARRVEMQNYLDSERESLAKLQQPSVPSLTEVEAALVLAGLSK